jgi:hypothetical protein
VPSESHPGTIENATAWTYRAKRALKYPISSLVSPSLISGAKGRLFSNYPPALVDLSPATSAPIMLRKRFTVYPRSKAGFALVIAITLMAFLVLLILGITTFLRVETGVASAAAEKIEAEQNALLALSQAIAALQFEMGPDQRISANADILSRTATVEHPFLVGVWDSSGDSSNETVAQRAGSLWQIGDGALDYTGRTSRAFRRWLIATDPNGAIDSAELTLAGNASLRNQANPEVVRLLGPGTLRPSASSTLPSALQRMEVWAPKIPLDSNLQTSGAARISWAVLDEGTKARVNLTPPERSTNAWDALENWSSPGTIGIETIGSSGEFADFPRETSQPDAVLNFNQIPFLFGGTPDGDRFGPFFHDVSPHPRSVMANVVEGGLRRDLSTLADSRPALYASRHLYSAANTGHPLNPQSDPRWSALLDFINLYKNDTRLAAGASGTVPAARLTRTEWRGNPSAAGQGDRAPLNRPLPAPESFRLSPAISKVEFYLSLFPLFPHPGSNIFADLRAIAPEQTAPFFAHLPGILPPSSSPQPDPPLHNQETINLNQPRQLYLVVVPAITFHNPYNVPLDLSGMWVVLRDPPVGLRFSFQDADNPNTFVPATNEFIPLAQMVAANHARANGGDVEQLRFAMRLESGILQPGETRVFAPQFEPGVRINDLANDQGNKQFDLTLAPGVIPDMGLIWDQFTPNASGMRNGAPVRVQGYILRDEVPTLETRTIRAHQANHAVVINSESILRVEVSLVDGTQNPVESGGNVIHDDPGPYNGTFTAEIFGTDPRIRANGLEDSSTANLIGRYVFNFDPGNDEIRGPSTGSALTARNNLLRQSTSRGNEDYVSGLIAVEEISHANLGGGAPWASRTKFQAFVSEVVPYTFAALRFSAKVTQDESGVAYHPGLPLLHTNHSSFSGHYNVGVEPSSMKAFDLSIEIPAGGAGRLDIPTDQGRHHTRLKNGIFFATQYEVPLSPLHSIASLQHADIFGGYLPRVRYAVGNSLAHPLLLPTSATGPAATGIGYGMFDHVYLANRQLWDAYYFSTVTDQRSVFFPSAPAFAAVVERWMDSGRALNPSLAFFLPAGRSRADAEAELISGGVASPEAYRRMAAYQLLDGGFNVNSTSVEAWKALLATTSPALTSLLIPSFDGTFNLTAPAGTGTGAVFSRFRLPNQASPAENSLTNDRLIWQGYRQLTSTQINDLAQRIVEEVQDRGPFLSLAEFINRRLAPGADPRSAQGTLEAAIQALNLNSAFEARAGRDLSAADASFILNSPGSELIRNRESLEAGNNTARGMPTSLTQADILQSVGARLTARSDTFVIRAYSEINGPGNSTVIPRVLEAVVQRVPDFVDDAQDPFHDSNPATLQPEGLSPVNETFGRQFRIVQFRWLEPNEI